MRERNVQDDRLHLKQGSRNDRAAANEHQRERADEFGREVTPGVFHREGGAGVEKRGEGEGGYGRGERVEGGEERNGPGVPPSARPPLHNKKKRGAQATRRTV